MAEVSFRRHLSSSFTRQAYTFSKIATAALPLFVLACCLVTPRIAHAHALLQKSDPAVNAVLHPGSHLFVLMFSSRVDAAHSSLTLAQGDHSQSLTIDTKAASNVLRSEAGALQPGHYALRWQAVAGDGHISRGEIPFDVK